MNGSNMHHCLKNIVSMVKSFLFLYERKLQDSGVTIIGILIRESEEQESFECEFCHLFSPAYKLFEQPPRLKSWWNFVQTYEGWWKLVNPKMQNKLFHDLPAEILCFMAMHEKGLPSLTDEKSQQFKQTYLLFTPKQMDIYFSDAKHIVIQGCYGSGKSTAGLKKVALILDEVKGFPRRGEKIIYMNFDRKSNLHISLEKNLIEYAGISSRKIQQTNGIQNILESPNKLIYVSYNSTGETLSTILQETSILSKKVKTKFHLIIEEYQGELLCSDEAAKITKLVKLNLLETYIIIIAKTLMIKRSLHIGQKAEERETCMFHELEPIFKIVKLDEVLRCTNDISRITKSIQNFVQSKESVFSTKIDVTFEQRQLPEGSEKHLVSTSVQQSLNLEVGTSRKLETSINENLANQANQNLDFGIDLDQAFQKSSPLKGCNPAEKKMIVSKFGFLCEPRQRFDIDGSKPNLVEFSENITVTSNIAVISLALVLKDFIGENKITAILYITDEQPEILRRAIQLLPGLLDGKFSYTEGGIYQNSKQSKIIISSNICQVSGMEFDHVIVVSEFEYYLKYYLPQTISRTTYDLNLILLPKEKMNTKQSFLQKLPRLHSLFSRTRDCETKENFANVIKEWKRQCLVKQVVVAECEACEEISCYSISDKKLMFEVHTHSQQYKGHLFHLATYTEFSGQAPGTNASALADIK